MFMNNLLAVALLLLLITGVQLAVWASFMKKRLGCGTGESLLGAFWALHIQILATQTALSLSVGLGAVAYALGLLLGTSTLFVFVRLSGMRDLWNSSVGWVRRLEGSRLLWVLSGVMGAAVAALLLVRVFFYFDLTWDTLSYSQPKIAFYYQQGSIFFNANAGDLRIDVNERNGELLFLHFVLLSGKTQALGFGYLWHWGSLVLGTFILLRRLGVKDDLSAFGALVFSMAPIQFAHITLVKGDTLALVYLVMALCFWKSDRAIEDRLTGGLLALAMAVCCKFTAIFAAATVGTLLLWEMVKRKTWPGWLRSVLLFVLGLLIFNKAVQNLLIWGNPFKRRESENEIIMMNLQGMLSNLKVFCVWSSKAFTEALSRDFINVGAISASILPPLFWGLAAALLLHRQFPRGNGRVGRIPCVSEFLAIVVAWGGLLFVMDLRTPGMSRFNAPFVYMLTLFLFAWILRLASDGWRRICVSAVAISAVISFVQDLRPTESFCHHGLRTIASQWVQARALERRLGYVSQHAEYGSRFEELQKKRATVLLAAPLDDAFFTAFGEDFAWRLDPSTMNLGPEKLCEKARPGDYILIPRGSRLKQANDETERFNAIAFCEPIYKDHQILLLRFSGRR